MAALRHILKTSLLAATLAVILCGCGKANDSAPGLTIAGKHIAGWGTDHGATYLKLSSQCRECHGSDLKGGSSAVSCFSSKRSGISCHAYGPHPLPFPTHNTVLSQTNNCTPCHGQDLGGGTLAPACTVCHVLLPQGTAPVLNNCDTCHRFPPNGGQFPNISGAHRLHTALAGVSDPVTRSCPACHTGGGTGTANHNRSLTIAFAAAYSVRGGSAAINSDNSCRDISCHGGLPTPGWRSGHFNSSTACEQCHRTGKGLAAPPFNSYSSGSHAKHITTFGLKCYDCHDMSVVNNGNSHFSGLASSAFDLTPALTIKLSGYQTSGSCSPGQIPATGSFTIGICHTAKSWR